MQYTLPSVWMRGPAHSSLFASGMWQMAQPPVTAKGLSVHGNEMWGFKWVFRVLLAAISLLSSLPGRLSIWGIVITSPGRRNK